MFGMQRFADDDAGYLSWLSRNPDGYVVSANRNPSPGYLILHRATCRTIAEGPANGGRWTMDYIKVCGNRAELERWAQNVVGGPLKPCVHCE
jgi:hypothetical protein